MHRWSQLFIPTLREAPADAEVASHKFLIRAGYIRQLAAGIYSYLFLGQRSFNKIIGIVRQEMDKVGQEFYLPALHPRELWESSGRWSVMGDTMFRLKDRKGADLCLGMTEEEVMTEIARKELRSYKQLPQIWYQIQSKFRDEARPKSGLLRVRQFLMKDSYSFDIDAAGLDVSYQKHYDAYCRIFDRCGLKYVVVEAHSGAMGGSQSHEFMVRTPAGEDQVVSCEKCNYAANKEDYHLKNVTPGDNFQPTAYADLRSVAAGESCPKCGAPLRIDTAVEIGHIFKLGYKYSESMGARVLDRNGKEVTPIMGSYGIGIERILTAAIEQSNDENGFWLPPSIAPFEIVVTPTNVGDEKLKSVAEDVAHQLDAAGFEVLLDDRDERPGVKFKDADLVGIPYRVTVGKKVTEGTVEVVRRSTREMHDASIGAITGYFQQVLRPAR